MGIASFASRRTQKTFTAPGADGELQVASGEPIQVCGIEFTAVSAAVYIVTDDDNTTLFTVAVSAGESHNLQTAWLADKGIKVRTDQTDGSVCVFHNSPGN